MTPPIELRQRSPLGACYRSPLGAFGSRSTPVIPDQEWRVLEVDTPDPNPIGLRTDCTLGRPGVTFYSTYIRLIQSGPSGPPPVSVAQDPVRFTGLTSGAVHVYPGSPCPVVDIQHRARLPSGLELGPYSSLVESIGAPFIRDCIFYLESPGSGFIVDELVQVEFNP